MAAQSNLAPVIIKKKKNIIGGGHHGGAWKVAYADFVTAMMAFFMMMWLLNATTEQQRQGLADYFSPTVPINRVSGGGDGSFGGDSVFSEETLPQNGLGATSEHATRKQAASGRTGTDADALSRQASDEAFESMIAELLGRGGESSVLDNALEHIVTRITDEGLVIELFALEDSPLFSEETADPTPVMRELLTIVSSVVDKTTNPISVGGHVRAKPVVIADNPVWETSALHATQTRLLLNEQGIDDSRIHRMTGHADRDPVLANPLSVRNDRVEIVLLRE